MLCERWEWAWHTPGSIWHNWPFPPFKNWLFSFKKPQVITLLIFFYLFSPLFGWFFHFYPNTKCGNSSGFDFGSVSLFCTLFPGNSNTNNLKHILVLLKFKSPPWQLLCALYSYVQFYLILGEIAKVILPVANSSLPFFFILHSYIQFINESNQSQCQNVFLYVTIYTSICNIFLYVIFLYDYVFVYFHTLRVNPHTLYDLIHWFKNLKKIM